MMLQSRFHTHIFMKYSILFAVLLFAGTLRSSESTQFNLQSLNLLRGVTEHTLDNGLKVIIKEDRSVPLVAVAVAYKVGFRDEDPATGKTGLTHLLEHMLFKGTHAYGKGEFSRIMKEYGARSNAYTSYDRTVYWQILPSAGFETAVVLEADRMVDALIDPEEFSAETRVVLSELSKYDSNPEVKLQRAMFKEAFGGHPLAALYGELEHVQNADRDYVYNSLYKQYYAPNNAYVIIVGDIDTDLALTTVSQQFGVIEANTDLPEAQTLPLEARTGIDVQLEGVASEDFGRLIFILPARDPENPDYLALSFISEAEIIGGFGYWNTGDWGLGYMSYTAEPDYPAETIDPDFIRANFNDFKKRLFNRERMQYDSINSIMRALTELERWSGIDSYYKYIQGYAALEADDIIRVIQKYLIQENSIRGFFKASTRDHRAKPQAISSTDGQYGSDIDASMFEKPDSGQLEALKTQNAALYPATVQALEEYFAPVQTTILPNGMKLIFRPFSMSDKVAIQVGVDAGSVFQTRPNLAEYTFNFVFNGGPQIRLKNALIKKGAEFGGRSRNDFANFSMQLAVEDFPDAINYLKLALRNRSFMEIILEEFKFNTISTVQRRANDPNPDTQAYLQLAKFIYGRDGIGHDFHAKAGSIIGVGMRDVFDFYRAHYRPEHMVITVVGNLEYAAVLQIIQSGLGDWKPQPVRVNRRQAVLKNPGKGKEAHVALDVMQSVIMMAAPSVNYTDTTNYTAMLLGNAILGGGGFSSRLMRVIRDREGLTYGVYSFLNSYREQSMMQIYMQNAPEDVGRALELLDTEVQRFLSEGPTEFEVLHFKNSFMNSIAFNYENAGAIAYTLMRYEVARGKALYDLDFVKILNIIDRKKIMDVMNTFYPKQFFRVIAGK